MLDDETFNTEEPIAIGGEGGAAADRMTRRVPAWPEGHTPANTCERDLWGSFEDLRIDPMSKLTQRNVAERIGRSRTSISSDAEGYKLLRKAIQDEVDRRRAPGDGKALAKTKPKKSKEQREAEKLTRRETSIKYFQDIAQRADAAVIDLAIRTVRAEDERDRLKVRIEAIFADFKAGLWKRADGSDGGLGEIGAFLSIPGHGAAAPAEGVSRLPARKDGKGSWRSRA